MGRVKLFFNELVKFFCAYRISKQSLSSIFFFLFLFQFSSYSAQENRKDSLNTSVIYLDTSVQVFSNDEIFSKQLRDAAVINQNFVSCEIQQKTENVNSIDEVEIRTISKIKALAFQNEDEVKTEVEKIEKSVQEFQRIKKEILQWEIIPAHSGDYFKNSTSLSKTYISPTVQNHFLDKYFAEKDFSAKENLKFIHSQKFTYYNSTSLDFCFSTVFSVRPPPFFS